MRLSGFYQAVLYLPPPPAQPLQRVLAPIEAPRLRQLVERYQEDDLVVVDDLFTEEALGVLLQYCHEATVFQDTRHGYLGAYLHQGLDSPVLLQARSDPHTQHASPQPWTVGA